MQINRHTFYPSKDTFNICAVSKKRERERDTSFNTERERKREKRKRRTSAI